MTEMVSREMPCEGCGVSVFILASDDIAGSWADGTLAVWCRRCWGRSPVVNRPDPTRVIDNWGRLIQ